MAMTLRLDAETQAALDRITEHEDTTATQAVRNAILEYDTKRTAVRDQLLKQIVSERKVLLDRLA